MKRLSKITHVWLLLLVSLHAQAGIQRCPEPVGPPPGNLGLGLVIQSNAPSHLPDFQVPVATYGVVLLYPLRRHRIYLQGSYGKESAMEVVLVEAGFRAAIPTPFLTFLLHGGAHSLSYRNLSVTRSHTYLGAHGGTGISFDLGSSLEATIGMKLLFQETPVFSYGATLSIML